MVEFVPWPGRGSYPVPPSVTLESCVSYDEWLSQPEHRPLSGFPLAAVTTLDLHLSAEALFLLSRGPQSAGDVEIVTSSDQDQDVATVEVVVSYAREDARNDAKVCVLSSHGGIGVGIFTRRWPFTFDRLHFATKVILPESSTDSPLLINKFETDVVNTAQRVGDLSEKVLFQSLRLKGSNGRIDVESVKADRGSIETSNAGISGVFNTSSLLVLATTNARVDADIGLSSVDASSPKLVLATTNAAVTSRISLISEESLGGSFEVATSTSNGRLTIDFPASPPDSILRFAGKTSNAEVAVSLNPAYEGSFVLKTSNAKPQINSDENVTDPSGRNRTRSLNIKHQRKGVALGDVFWDDAIVSKAGSVVIRTSNAKIDLNL